MNGLVLWISGLTPGTADHSATLVSNGSPGASDLDLCWKLARFGAGDVFLTISVSHWSALGSGEIDRMGRIFCGEGAGDEVPSELTTLGNTTVDGEADRGKDSLKLLKVEVRFEDDTATTLLNLDGIDGASSKIFCCWMGIAVPIGIVEFAVEISGR